MNEFIRLGSAIQKRRENLSLTQDDLSDRAHLAYSTLSKIERGVIKNPSVFTVASIAACLGCSVEDLLLDRGVERQQSKQIEFLFCDLNGVLVRFFQRAFTQIADDYSISADRVETIFWHYNDAANRGEMSTSEFSSVMGAQLGIADLNWQEIYLTNVEPIKQMQDLVKKLVKTHKIGILSNIHAGHIEKMIKRGIIPDLDYACIVDSSQVGAIKPEPRIYEIAEQMSGAKGDEILFIDDSRTNLMAAERFGWRVLWFDDFRPGDSVERVKQALNYDRVV